jgi:pimeloyl-ACP methyl ester carboxylesterase
MNNVAGQIEIVQKQANGMTFRCRVAGNPEGEPVLLLHGWPETSHMWAELLERLAENGNYCIAPDQRGFSPEARPTKVSDYDIKFLVEDVMAIADAFGISNFHLIGHDWGAAIGWAVVAEHAQRIKSWSALSIPHIRAFSDALRFDEEQKKKSQYMALFQWRGIPEWMLLRKDRNMLRKTWKKSSEAELTEYLDVIGNKPALKATLAYYRANYKTLKKGKDADRFGDVKTPTLFIWGNRDIAVTRTAAEGTHPFMKGDYKFVELDAGHWLMQEAFEDCAQPILDHLNKNK